MNKWLEKYNEITRRTRWISICLGICLWLLLIYAIVAFIHWVYSLGEMDRSRMIEMNLDNVLFVVVSISLITCRQFALIKSNGKRLRLARITWVCLLLLFPVANIYLYLDSIGYFAPVFDCIPIGKTICFGVYGSSAPVWLLAMFYYLSIGIVGIIAKSIYATFAIIRSRPSTDAVDHI